MVVPRAGMAWPLPYYGSGGLDTCEQRGHDQQVLQTSTSGSVRQTRGLGAACPRLLAIRARSPAGILDGTPARGGGRQPGGDSTRLSRTGRIYLVVFRR